MKTKLTQTTLVELTPAESRQVSGGGAAAELAYNIVYFGLRSNPLFWVARYDAAAIGFFS